MSLPPDRGGPSGGSNNPFGAFAFRVGIIGCLAMMGLSVVLVLFAGGDLRAIGIAMLALGGVALFSTGVAFAIEARALRRAGTDTRPPPRPREPHSNGHAAPPRFRRRGPRAPD